MRFRGSFSPVMRSTIPTRDSSPISCKANSNQLIGTLIAIRSQLPSYLFDDLTSIRSATDKHGTAAIVTETEDPGNLRKGYISIVSIDLSE